MITAALIVRVSFSVDGVRCLPRRASQMPVTRRFEGIGTQDTPISRCKAKPKERIRPAKFTNENRRPCLAPCLTLTPFNAPVFTKALILLIINEVVAGAGIEPATQGFSVLCSTN